MDAKIKDLLTRLSFFAEDGMTDKPIVEIAKQADALLLEMARKPSTRQPVAQITGGKTYISVELLDSCPVDLPNGTQLYLAQPVPRDVLMAFGEAVRDAAKRADFDIGEDVDIAAIADRYASKVQPEPATSSDVAALLALADRIERMAEKPMLVSLQAAKAIRAALATKPEPVNLQLLCVAHELDNFQRQYEQATWQPGRMPGNELYGMRLMQIVNKARAAIAAAEAAQPVVQDGYAQGVEAVAKMLEKKADDFASENGYDDMGSLSFGGNLNGELMRDYHSGLLELAEEVRAMKIDCQHPASAKSVAVSDTQAAQDLLAERRRQIDVEGWTPENDDKYLGGQLAAAAAAYAMTGCHSTIGRIFPPKPPGIWPWDQSWWKPSTTRRDMVKAAALLLAEIERIDRAAAQKGGAA